MLRRTACLRSIQTLTGLIVLACALLGVLTPALAQFASSGIRVSPPAMAGNHDAMAHSTQVVDAEHSHGGSELDALEQHCCNDGSCAMSCGTNCTTMGGCVPAVVTRVMACPATLFSKVIVLRTGDGLCPGSVRIEPPFRPPIA